MTFIAMSATLLSAIAGGTKSDVPLADPYILLDGNTYYAYGTHNANGIEVWTSYDLREWKYKGLALDKRNTTETRWFWAPEVYHKNGRYYMYYSANEHLYVATADSPLGPFVQQGSYQMEPLIGDEKCIDSHVFFDDSGSAYLFFVRFTDGNCIWMCRLEDDLITPRKHTLCKCIAVSQDWEMKLGRVCEGPNVVKHDNMYYLTYSGNDYHSQDYGVGYATSPSLTSPRWEKYQRNPVLQKIDGLVGTGHHSLFTDKDGIKRIAFHAHNSTDSIHPRLMYIGTVSFDNGRLTFIGDSIISPVEKKNSMYTNPVVDQSLPDPTVIKADDGFYYLYATENIRNLPIYKSADLVNWQFVGTAFTDETRPQMVSKGSIWAPDINLIDGRYVLYYSKSEWGGEWECGIGVATADSPDGSFTDHGRLFISKEIGVQNSIDPFYIEDNGHKYLFWGSFRGIYGIELTADGLGVKPGEKPRQIAGTMTEGTYIINHDGYYYLIGSAGSCCDGAKSTYHMVMARSESLFGPYVNREGKAALDNGFSPLLNRSDKVVGPGHCSEFVQDDEGTWWVFYHGFSADDINGGRKLFLDRVDWDGDGWPVIKGMVPSESARNPVINK